MEDINNLKLYELYYMLNVYSLYEDDLIPYDIKDIWQKIAIYYNQEFGTLLDKNIENNRNHLFNWLRNKTRYELLDELMLHVYSRLIYKEEGIDNTDPFFVNNIYPILIIMEEYSNKIVSDIYKINNIKVSTISKKETISIVKDILTEIDPNNEWLDYYEEAINNHKIIYLNELTSEEENNLKNKFGLKSLKDIDNSCMSLENNDTYIFLNYTNSLYDIPTTIHELIHYIIKKTNYGSTELPILREFPSIFFEMYAIDYLRCLGYSEEELACINRSRLIDTFRVYDDVKDLVFYLIIIMENGHINEKIAKKACAKELNKIKRKLTKEEANNILKENQDFFNASKKASDSCDKCTYNLVINPYILFNYYPYAIGSYLADIALNKTKTNKMILSMLKYMTEKISKLDAYDIFSVLECNTKDLVPTTYTEEIPKKKRKVRDK